MHACDEVGGCCLLEKKKVLHETDRVMNSGERSCFWVIKSRRLVFLNWREGKHLNRQYLQNLATHGKTIYMISITTGNRKMCFWLCFKKVRRMRKAAVWSEKKKHLMNRKYRILLDSVIVWHWGTVININDGHPSWVGTWRTLRPEQQ